MSFIRETTQGGRGGKITKHINACKQMTVFAAEFRKLLLQQFYFW
jgi:hypothetical protein